MADTQIGLVPQLQDLAKKFIQKEQQVVKTVDTVSKALTAPNGLKIPSASSLQKLLGSLPTGISTITNVSQTFSSQASGLDVGGFLNSAIATAQQVSGAISTVVGAASALGVNIGALGDISQAITGVNPNSRIGGGRSFSMTPEFEHAIENADTGFTFPLDLDEDTNMERIMLSISEYQKNSVVQPAQYNKETSIFLPIPRNLSESYSPLWLEMSPGPVRGLLAEWLKDAEAAGGEISTIAGNALAGAQKGLDSTLKGIDNASTGDKVLQTASALQLGMYYNFIPKLDEVTNGSTYGLISNFTGRTVNPYTTVSFQGMGLRQHNFMWVLAPRSEKESAQLDKIFHILRKAALPKNSNGFYLEYPKVVNVKFLPNESALYNFKRCVINSLDINHAGSGQPSFFNKTGKPTVYVLSLGLKEIELYTSNDIDKSSEETSPVPNFKPDNITAFSDYQDNIFSTGR